MPSSKHQPKFLLLFYSEKRWGKAVLFSFQNEMTTKTSTNTWCLSLTYLSLAYQMKRRYPTIKWLSLLQTYFPFSLPPDKLVEYPAWLIVFLSQIILPMIGVVIIAIKIIMKNGKDMSRELLGVNFQSTNLLPNNSLEKEAINTACLGI